MDPDVTSPEGRPTPASLTRHVLLFCGKRKSGKDFVTDKLMEMIPGNEKGVIIRLSGPLKKCYAKDNGLEYKKLLEATEYKEKHRKDMIKWSEEIRNRDYGYFCRAALEMYEADRFSILIVSDCRRKTDFRFFEEKYPGKCLRIRVRAPEEVRKSRGFVFQPGVDDAESECGLDDVGNIDHVIENDGEKSPDVMLKEILQIIRQTQM